ncbi:MAG: hypothetical protein IPJ76_08855 [Flavobacteriales bacterium]|nr:MAG: hypothetical protein IPJ76_08855 [Flavobacteriales bacterium]
MGTIIVALYYWTSSSELLIAGYWFIVVAALVNVAVLTALLVKASKARTEKKLLITCGLMLLNIPVAVGYMLLVVTLLDTMRITFTNMTNTPITDISIEGCEAEHIDELEVGESRTVWISISGDCDIAVDFLSNGTRKREIVAPYVTSSMGQKLEHNIGGRHGTGL